MFKRVISIKGVFALALMTMLLSGCENSLAKQEETSIADTGGKLSDNLEIQSISEPPEEDGSANRETTASASEEKTSVELTDQGKAFLERMCRELNDFHAGAAMDEKFWRDFLFYSYTGMSSENAETEQIYREDLGFEETVVKISLQEAKAHAKLVLGIELPEFTPSFEDMEQGQTSFYYQDGYYYIGVSGFPDYQCTFSESAAGQESENDTIVTYNIDFMGESNVGTVKFAISPENNDNGFVIRAKTTEFYN